MAVPSFLIRGHHLDHFAELASWRADPYDLSRAIVRERLHDRERSTAERAYSQDVIGNTIEEARVVMDSFKSAFTQFKELDQEDLVVITTGEKDLICQGCVIGNHCSERGAEMAADTDHGKLQVYEKDLGDMRAITAFKKLAVKLDAQDKLDPTLDTHSVAHVPAPSPKATPIIESNMIEFEPPLQASAGYVKAVLAHWTLAQMLHY